MLAASTDIVVVTDITLAGLRDAIRLHMHDPAGGAAALASSSSPTGTAASEATVSKAEFEKALGKSIDVRPRRTIAKANQAAANAGKPVVAAAASSKMTGASSHIATSIAVGRWPQRQAGQEVVLVFLEEEVK